VPKGTIPGTRKRRKYTAIGKARLSAWGYDRGHIHIDRKRLLAEYRCYFLRISRRLGKCDKNGFPLM